ncbi:hypothetical protein [Arthrobacter sp. NicSoilB8]|uniref:hypothetical protein n=1 Tax=Arthrobacter sp. NicSoilB8 TaxID=2830998 RepID=UPI001CC6697E|nr:hypothetical protein [Arthrobacter sp. NicSoilB8]BCW73529.1 hypothetical protein NicSoilB8_45730 [Arthrobacter sp. NicSoilB8]
MSRHVIDEATAESGDGHTLTLRALTALGEPCVANRGAVDVIVTAPDGTCLSFRLPGEQAELIAGPLARGAFLRESEADVARRYLRTAGDWMSAEQIADLKHRAGE